MTALTTYVASLSPLFYGRLNEVSSLVDSSGLAHHGTFAGTAPTVVAGLADADSDQAVLFPGGTSRGQVPYGSWMDTPSWTAVASVKPTANNTAANIISRYVSGNFTTGPFAVRIDGGNLTCYYFSAGTYSSVAGGAIPIGVISDVAMSYDHTTSTFRAYVNGILVGSNTRAQNTTPSAGLSIGGDWSGVGAEAFPGIVDEAMYFGYVLTAAQIGNISYYRNGPSRVWANTGSLANGWDIGAGALINQSPIPTGSPGFAAAGGGNAPLASAATPPLLETNGAQSLELWFTKPAAAVNGALFKIGVPDSGGWGVGIGGAHWDGAGHNLIVLRESINWHVIGSALTTAQHHLVVTRTTGDVIQIYLDNVLVQNASFGSINGVVAGGRMGFGGYVPGTRNLPSTVPMDRISIFSGVLSAARVAAHWNGGAGDDAAVMADSPLVHLDLSTRVDLVTSSRMSGQVIQIPMNLDGIAARSSGQVAQAAMYQDNIHGRLTAMVLQVVMQKPKSSIKVLSNNEYMRLYHGGQWVTIRPLDLP